MIALATGLTGTTVDRRACSAVLPPRGRLKHVSRSAARWITLLPLWGATEATVVVETGAVHRCALETN